MEMGMGADVDGWALGYCPTQLRIGSVSFIREGASFALARARQAGGRAKVSSVATYSLRIVFCMHACIHTHIQVRMFEFTRVCSLTFSMCAHRRSDVGAQRRFGYATVRQTSREVPRYLR